VSNPRKTAAMDVRRVDHEVLVHDAAHGRVHVLNGTAGNVLDLCDGMHSASQIAHALSTASGADLSRVRQDVDAILNEFTLLDLLVP
jgi:hypothetical protein